MSKKRRELERERKILQTRKKVDGHLCPLDRERLRELEDQLAGPPPIPARDSVPDLSEPEDEWSDSTVREDQETMVGESPEDQLTTDPNAPQQAAIEQVSPDDWFTDSVVRKERTMTGARPVDLSGQQKGQDGAERRPNDLSGPRQVVVRLMSGLTRQGVLEIIDPASRVILLEPPRGSDKPSREIAAHEIRTIMVMLPDGLALPKKSGPHLTVVFKNGQDMAGASPDYKEENPAFTLLPSGDKYIERVIVFRHAVRNIDFDELG